MKVVINRCHGGYSLSPKAIKRLAELQGRPCYFFTGGIGARGYTRAPDDFDARRTIFFTAFDVPDPNVPDFDYSKHVLDARPENRSDPLLLQVIEELGEAADGSCADLQVVEIPDDVKWHVEEYDGMEWIAEDHRTWP